MVSFSLQREFIERLHWLVRLRWLAVIGVFLTVFSVSRIFKLSLPVFPLYSIAIILALYNLAFLILLVYIKERKSKVTMNIIANIQIFLDLLMLVALIHFSGGIENPFLFYFVFHMIIAGILLSRQAAFLQATFAVALFCFMIILEYFGVLHHYCLGGFILHSQHNNLIYIIGISFVFVSTIYIAVYMASSISDKLKQREEILEEANEQLKEKDRLKSEYVLRVSHDIKEHLAAIQGCLEPVIGKITGELNPKQFDLVERAVQRTNKLLFFVKALLEITRIKLSKEIKMDYFYFKDIIYETVNNISSKAQDKNIAIDYIIEPTVDRIRGVKEYLQETIANLLANSIKYTPNNGRIDIKVKDKGNSILVEIQDTGIGIPKDEMPKIFEEFYRASNAREVEKDGTGLGLSIARRIVQMHQGKIWVESEAGKGSVFSIELPK